MRSLLVVAAAVLIGALALPGCSPSTSSPVDDATAAREPVPFLPGPAVGWVTHERSPDKAAYDAASATLEAARDTLLAGEYEYGRPDDKRLPDSADEFVREARLHMIPVYELVEPSGEATSVFPYTRLVPGEHVVLVSLGEEIVGAYDWSTDPVYGGPRHSFYDGFHLDFPRAVRLVQEHFGGRMMGVRYVKVPRGYWVVGSNGWQERAAFVVHQGDYPDDPPDHLLFTPQDVFAYGNRHAGGD